MKRSFVSSALILSATLATDLFNGTAYGERTTQPNLIIIYADDLGYNDVGVNGSTVHATPNIDRLAAQGVRMTDFYMTSAICTPSRVALLTGRHPARVGFDTLLWPTSAGGLPHKERTIAEVLSDQGYTTAIFGKWHLGHSEEIYLPMYHGFDEWFGMPYPNDMDPGHPQTRIRKETWPEMPMMRGNQVTERPINVNVLTQQYTAKALAFIAENHHKPFFLFLSHSLPHAIIGASPDFVGTSGNGLFGDAVQEIDWSTGEILRVLRAFGLEENTMILFTSDNGAVNVERFNGVFDADVRRFHPDLTFGNNKPLRAGKQSTYEGGIRVPGIFYWPGTIPAGVVENQPAWIPDLLPTFADFAGIQLPDDRNLDGVSLRQLLVQSEDLPERPLIFGGKNPNALRLGDWKLVMPNQPRIIPVDSDKPMLYNLADDIGETTNLAAEYPEKVNELVAMLQSITAEMQADTLDDGPYPDVPNLVPNHETFSLPNGKVGNAYSAQLMASSGNGELAFSLISPPDWLSIDASGNLTGNPPVPGTFNVTVRVADMDGDEDSATLVLTIDPASGGGGGGGGLTAAFTGTAPTIDGDLNESLWTLPLSTTRSIIGASDNTIQFEVRWDATALYVAYHVLDANLIADGGGLDYTDDSLEVYFDLDNVRGSYDRNNSPFERQIVRAYNSPVATSSGVTTASKAVQGGYTGEMQILWSAFSQAAAPGKIIGFDIGCNDDDNGGSRDSQVMAYGDGNNWRNTSNFASFTLTTPVDSPFKQWLENMGGNTAADPAMDPTGEDLSLLERYAFGFSPDQAVTGRMPQFHVPTSNPAQMVLNPLPVDPEATGVAVIVQTCHGLGNDWTEVFRYAAGAETANGATVTARSPNAEGNVDLTLNLHRADSGSNAGFFCRVIVQQVP